MVLLGVLGEEAPARGLGVGRRGQRRRAATGALDAGALDELDERVVVHRAGRRHHHVGGDVAGGVEGAQSIGTGRVDDVGAADDGPPERVPTEDRLAEDVEDLVLRVVLVHGDLLEHDLALLLEL